MAKVFMKVYLFLLVLVPLVATAQFNMGSIINYSDELNIETIPIYPKPRETVSLNLKMYTENLNSSEISWFKNGKLELSGIGKTFYSFITSEAGQSSEIEIRIKTLNGVSFSKKIIINPASVDLIWEADSYTPPFYQGKALHAPQGSIKVLAMPNFYNNGSEISPAKLIYKWTINNEVDENQSGYGKNIVFISGSMLGIPIEVELFITDPVSRLTASSYLTVKAADPEIVFYENHPLYGIIFEKAISEINLDSSEFSVVAVPYNINMGPLDDLKYSWRINSSFAPEISGLSATFRRPDNVSGSSLVSLSVENKSRILQFSKNSFLVNFNKNENI